MKIYRITALLVIFALVVPLCVFGSEYDGLNKIQKDAGTLDGYMKKGADIAYRITELTGVALSPLVGLVVIGGIEYYKAKKEGTPVKWYFSLWFMGVITAIIAFIGLKDTIGEAAPFLKKPLDVLDFFQHKFAGIIAFAIVAPRLILAVLEPVGQTISLIISPFIPATAWAGESVVGGVAGIVGWVLIVAIVLSALAAALFFGIIWLAAGAVETLILLAPVPFVGVILRIFRLSILGVLAFGAAASPAIGIVLSLVILYVSYRILGWSFRLTVFGWILVTDIISGRRHYENPEQDEAVAAFSTSEFRKVKNRTYGKLVREGKELCFVYRPFLVLPRRRIMLEEKAARIGMARGTLLPTMILLRDDHKKRPALFTLPPRYAGHEEAISKLLKISPEIHDRRFGRRLKDAWHWIIGQVKNGEAVPEAA